MYAPAMCGTGHIRDEKGQEAETTEQQIAKGKGIGVALREDVGLVCGMVAKKVGPCYSRSSRGPVQPYFSMISREQTQRGGCC